MSFWNSSEILQQKSLFIVLLHFSKPFFGNPRIYSVQKFWIKTCAINISELRKWNALFKCKLPANLARKNSCAQTHESEPLRAKDSAPPQRWVQNNQSYTCRALFSPLRSFDFPTFGPFLPPSVSLLFARAGTCQFIFKFKCKNRIRPPAKRIELNFKRRQRQQKTIIFSENHLTAVFDF